MTDAKALPDNLADIEQTDAFKKIDEAHTIKQLEKKLRDAGVPFLSADNKPALVWRLLDAQDAKAEGTDLPANDTTIKTDVETDGDIISTATDSDTPKADGKKKADIQVKNTGSFNVLEPASLTLLKAGEITDIFTTPKANKQKILANIKQINTLRGDNLKIIE